MKTKSECIEIYNKDVFYLKRRRLLNIKSVSLDIFGADIKTNGKKVLEIGDEIALSNDKVTISKNTSILCACINMGKYFYQNKSLLYDIASNYYKAINIDDTIYTRWARRDFSISNIHKYTLTGNFRNLDTSKINSLDIDIDEDLAIKWDRSKLEELLLNWFECCGILESEYHKSLKDNQFINMDSLLIIFDSCLSIYNFYLQYSQGKINKKVRVDVTNILSQDNNGNLIVEKKVTDILSLAILSTITYCRNDYKILKECAYCHNLFFGRKNKLCCSQNCKDLKNRKYEKRRLKNSI